MKTRIFASLAAAGLLLGACSSGDSGDAGDAAAQPSASAPSQAAATASTSNVLAEHGLADLSTKELIEKLDALPVAERPTDFMASVRPDHLLIADASGVETELPIEEDSFYLSFNPYVKTTHECYFHSLTTCRGELANKAIHVTITDNASGEVLVDEDATTYDNGFYGVWLPKGIEATLTVTTDGLSGTAVVSTKNADDLTCLATLQLS
ncbi:MAG: CueP family metal-binding protein [Ancrocorticia sp.]